MPPRSPPTREDFELRKQVGLRIQELRGKRPQRESGTAQNWLSRLEKGTRNPSLDMLGRIARALGVAPFELLRPPGTPLSEPVEREAVRNLEERLHSAVHDILQRWPATRGRRKPGD